MSAPPDPETTVRALLGAAGIPATEEEIAQLAVDYPRLRALVEILHTMPAARYEAPALHFDPTAPMAPWGSTDDPPG